MALSKESAIPGELKDLTERKEPEFFTNPELRRFEIFMMLLWGKGGLLSGETCTCMFKGVLFKISLQQQKI